MLQIEPRPLIMSVPPTSTQNMELKPSLHYTGLLYLVGRSPTLAKNGGLGDIPIPEFVPLQEFSSPIRLQHLSVQRKWTFKCYNYLIPWIILVSFPNPLTHALPLPLNYRNMELKKTWEGSGK